jgi:hypothetical protein
MKGNRDVWMFLMEEGAGVETERGRIRRVWREIDRVGS